MDKSDESKINNLNLTAQDIILNPFTYNFDLDDDE